jgi:hypothetical protein
MSKSESPERQTSFTLTVGLLIGLSTLAFGIPVQASSLNITEIIDATGDGAGNGLDGAVAVAVDSSGNVFLTGLFSDNAFEISPIPVPAVPRALLVLLALGMVGTAFWVMSQPRSAHG